MEVTWIVVIHIDIKWSAVSIGISHRNLIHADLQSPRQTSAHSRLRIDPRLRLEPVRVQTKPVGKERGSRKDAETHNRGPEQATGMTAKQCMKF